MTGRHGVPHHVGGEQPTLQAVPARAAQCTAAVRRGEIAPRDFRVAALAQIGAGSAIVYDWIRNTPGQAPDALRRELSDVCLRLLVS